MLNLDIDTLVPQRRPMRLIDEIIAITGQSATTVARVVPTWPTVVNGAAHVVVLIELVAQTAAAIGGYNAMTDPTDGNAKKGMLVGIKEAAFAIDTIPLNTRITTWAETRVLLENFKEITGVVTIGDRIIGEMTLQGVQSE
jgi:predicted hotdog family 3-hydroxylacyl-ACP dehydratase